MVSRLFRWLDHVLVCFAAPFGARISHAGWQSSILLGIYTTLYLLSLTRHAGVALAALGIGYLGVLAMGRAWAANERKRACIAKKLAAGNPDDLPDLRGAALLSALQLAVLFPLLFQALQESFQLYRVPPGTTLLTWVAFSFDSFCKLFVNFGEIYDATFTRIEFASIWGRHLVLLKRVTFEYLLLQGLLRLWDIHNKTREAVAAIRQDVDLAVRLGRRAVTPLLRLLGDPDPVLRRQAARALGVIRAPSALAPLRRLLTDESTPVREAAAQALGQLGDPNAVEPLITVLQKEHSEKIVLFHDRQQAAEALGSLGDLRAVLPLMQVLEEGKGTALAPVRQALASIQAGHPFVPNQ